MFSVAVDDGGGGGGVGDRSGLLVENAALALLLLLCSLVCFASILRGGRIRTHVVGVSSSIFHRSGRKRRTTRRA